MALYLYSEPDLLWDTLGFRDEPIDTSEFEQLMTRQQLKQRYKFQWTIGNGAFGEVWQAVDSVSGRVVAIKLINLERSGLPQSVIEEEVQTLQTVGRHPHVVELLNVSYVTSDAGPSARITDVALIMEFAAGGGLFERLVAEGYYTEVLASSIMRQIALAVYHCHSRGILHRDIKPDNVNGRRGTRTGICPAKRARAWMP